MADEFKPQMMIDMLWPGIRAIQANGPPVKDFSHRDGGYYLTRNDGESACILTDAEVRDESWRVVFKVRVQEALR